jgi:DnaJ-domain-containing protein 1
MPRTDKPKKIRKFSDVFAKYRTYDTSAGYGDAREWRAAFAERMGADVYEPILRDAARTADSILGVSFTATWDQVRSAYRKLAMQWHPDRAVQNRITVDAATERFKQINAAYSKLADRYGR